MKASTVRASLRDLMRATVKQEPQWHYRQVRPLPLGRSTLHVPVETDCSGGIVVLCEWAGAPSPTGKYDGYGNSQSFYYHLPHIQPSEAVAGDIITYGKHDGEQHTVMVYEPGPDPLVWSHGQEAGPLFIRHSAELAAHPGATATFLRLMPADPPPAPKPVPVRVDVYRDDKPWLRNQKPSNPAVRARVWNAIKAGTRKVTIRRAK